MRKALIVGFFDSVEEAIRTTHGAAIDRGEIIVVGLGRVDPRRGINLETVRSAFAALPPDCTDLMVLIGRSATWVEDSLMAILAQYSERFRVDYHVFYDLRDATGVVEKMLAFGLQPAPPDTDSIELQKAIDGRRFYCVCSTNQSGFERALHRFGFRTDGGHFIEEVVPDGKNSNLVNTLVTKANNFDWLLYAWLGLRTLPADVKRKFRGGCIEGDSPAKVVSLLKRRLLGR